MVSIKERIHFHFNNDSSVLDEPPESNISFENALFFRYANIHRNIKSKKYLGYASKALMSKIGNISSGNFRFGVLLASECTNLNYYKIIKEQYLDRLSTGPKSECDEFYQLIQNFPEATDLRLLGDLWGARGPQVNIYGRNIDCLYPIADLMFKADRVDQLLLCAIQSINDEEFFIEIAYAENKTQSSILSNTFLGPGSFTSSRKTDSASSLAKRSLTEFIKKNPVEPSKTILLCSTFLGTGAQLGHSMMLGTTPPEDFRVSMNTFSANLGFKQTYFICGFAGASLSALMIGSDIIGLGHAEQVIICSADILTGVLDQSLYLVGCEDRPNIGEGAACCLLTKNVTKRGSLEFIQFSPNQHLDEPIELDLSDPLFSKIQSLPVKNVIISGLINIDIENGKHLACQIWQNVRINENHTLRLQASDALAKLILAENIEAIFCANHLVGTGAVVIYDSTIQSGKN